MQTRRLRAALAALLGLTCARATPSTGHRHPLLRSLPTIHSAGLGALLGDDSFCDSAPLCELVPRDAQGRPAYYNGSDPTRPWVLGRSDTIVWTGGQSVAPGVLGALGVPVIFLVDEVTVQLAAAANDARPVLVAGVLVACDSSRIHLDRGFLALNQTRPQQFPWFLFDNASATAGPEVTVRAVSPALPDTLQSQWAFFLAGQASLVAQGGPAFQRFGQDVWELAALEAATVLVDSPPAFLGETYVGHQASLTLRNLSYVDVFFESCSVMGVRARERIETSASASADSWTLELPRLPGLCTIGDADLHPTTDDAGGNDDDLPICATPAQRPISFHLTPPTTPFMLSVDAARVFAWAVAAHPGSRTLVEAVPRAANFNFGLSALGGNLSLAVTTGGGGAISGLTDRVIQVGTASTPPEDCVVDGWNLWFDAPANVTLASGSVIGDLALAPDSFAMVQPWSQLSQGQLYIQAGTSVVLDAVMLADQVILSAGGTLVARTSDFEGPAGQAIVEGLLLSCDGTGIFAPSEQLVLVGPTAAVLNLTITTPPQNSSFMNPPLVNFTGTVDAFRQVGGPALDPFPAANFFVRTNDCAGDPQLRRNRGTNHSANHTNPTHSLPPILPMGQVSARAIDATLVSWNDPCGALGNPASLCVTLVAQFAPENPVFGGNPVGPSAGIAERCICLQCIG